MGSSNNGDLLDFLTAEGGLVEGLPLVVDSFACQLAMDMASTKIKDGVARSGNGRGTTFPALCLFEAP